MTELKKEMVENGIHYTLHGDYYLPDIVCSEEKRPIGKWGRMHREYLKETNKLLLNELLLTDRLHSYLADLNEQAQGRYERIIQQMAEAEKVNEELKRRCWIEWVRSMQNIVNRAKEIILHEMIYA
ncbi:TnpV protein [Eisenbergiella sp.]